MVSECWKPTLISILLTAVLSVNGRPAESNVDNDLGDRNGVQILEFNSLDSDGESERKNAILKKLFYNVSRAGLHVPVQVIYDPPYTLVADLLQGQAPNAAATSNVGDSWPKTTPAANSIRADRASRHRNWTEATNENPKQYFLGGSGSGGDGDGDELAGELVSIERELLKSINRTKNPFAFFFSRPEFWQQQRINNTGKRVPIIFHFFSPPANKNREKNDTKVDHKYIIPILDKLKEFNDRHPPSPPPPEPQAAQSYAVPQFLPATSMPYKRLPSPLYYPNPTPLVPYYASNAVDSPYAPQTYVPFPTPHYYPPYDMYRQWTNPYAEYPVLVRESYQTLPNPYYVSANGDLCHRKPIEYSRMRRTMELQQPEESNTTVDGQQTENGEFEFGKRRYDDSPTIEYVDNVRQKRTAASRRKTFRPAESNLLRRRENTVGETKKEDTAAAENEMSRAGSDVGPQISKLIVRRGGVAIAGAGGIATAGSGGTAIVGPGGTAFTTPASSGGVAMVGPGGKVVKVPDITNVLYGRTAQVAATGAGHSTFTDKDGQVFTTSDTTGGVALVNPGGDLIGLSDGETLEASIKTSDTNQIQLPAGARLLTTGPIIYYNPVYPMSQL